MRATIAALFRRRVPVRYQMAAADCGAACLSMILAFHGRRIGLRACRDALGIGRDGTSLRRIAGVARGFGLAGEVSAPDARGLLQGPLPAIISYPRGHFVVVESASLTHVSLVDPSRGRLRVARAHFARRFSGPVLRLTPQPPEGAVPAADPPAPGEGGAGVARFVLAVLAVPGIRNLLAQIFAASVVVQLLAITLPFFGKVLIDGVVGTGDVGLMGVLIGGAASLVAAQVGMGFLRGYAELALQRSLDGRLMAGLFAHLFSLPYRAFQERSLGDLLQRFESAVLLRELMASRSVSVSMDALLILGFSTTLLWMTPGFGALVLALGFLHVILSSWGRRRLGDLAQQEIDTGAQVNGFLVEALTGAALLKAAGAEKRAFTRWSKLHLAHQMPSVEKERLLLAMRSSLDTVALATSPLLLAFGARYVLAGEWTLGTLMAMTTLARSLIAPIGSLAEFVRTLPVLRIQLERLMDLAEEPAEQPVPGVAPPARLRGRIEVRQVSFQFPGSSEVTLKDISFSLEPGRKLAVVGASGAGKSTLAGVLLGLHRPCRGSVHVDGRDVFEYDIQSLRQQIGVVLQEPFLFRGTVRENIAFCNPAMPLRQVQQAAAVAALHEEILALPMGYDTMLAEGGAGLSGGQRQRLAIARALAQDPAILVLDEATSHLDAVTEERVARALDALPCTQVVIAHRLSTVRSADTIVVLENGRLAQMGRHDELLAEGGAYATLFAAQLGNAAPTAAGRGPLDANVSISAAPPT
jgi:ATP-binding cassette, subfamily B, bacterial